MSVSYAYTSSAQHQPLRTSASPFPSSASKLVFRPCSCMDWPALFEFCHGKCYSHGKFLVSWIAQLTSFRHTHIGHHAETCCHGMGLDHCRYVNALSNTQSTSSPLSSFLNMLVGLAMASISISPVSHLP